MGKQKIYVAGGRLSPHEVGRQCADDVQAQRHGMPMLKEESYPTWASTPARESFLLFSLTIISRNTATQARWCASLVCQRSGKQKVYRQMGGNG